MTKVAYNACYGGFGLSHEAMLRYGEIKGIALYPVKETGGFGLWTYWTVPEGQRPDMNVEWYAMPIEERVALNKRYAECVIYDKDIPRDDPALIQVIEELGDAASGYCAKLRIEDVPKGTQYRIDEYDGNESVATRESYDWQTA